MFCTKCQKGRFFQKRVILTVEIWEDQEWRSIDRYVNQAFLKCDKCGHEIIDDGFILDDQIA